MVGYNTKFREIENRREENRRVHHDLILLDDEWEVIYWCLVLKCTKERLVDTVRRFGNSASVIRDLFASGHREN